MTTLKEMPEECRPREKAVKLGINSLGIDELIAILLRTGYKNNSVKIVANRLLSELNSFQNIENLSINRIASIKGVGLTKAITILAAIELGNRLNYNTNLKKININNTRSVYEYLKADFLKLNQEQFIVLLLDSKKKVIDKKVIFKGDLNSVNVHPREIFKYAILNSAASIIVSHNHPSGDTFPSKQDVKITRELVKIGVLIQIPIIDHLIIGNNTYYSFYENGDLDEKK